MTAVPKSLPLRSPLATISAYVALTKPRIIELLLVTTLPAMLLAARGIPGPGLLAATLIGGALAAGSANALQLCAGDRDIDAVMRRTATPPTQRHGRQPPGPRWCSPVVLGVAAVEPVSG